MNKIDIYFCEVGNKGSNWCVKWLNFKYFLCEFIMIKLL